MSKAPQCGLAHIPSQKLVLVHFELERSYVVRKKI